MKTDGRLDRNWLKVALGRDARGAVRRRPQPTDDPQEAAVFYAFMLALLLSTLACKSLS